MGVLFYSLGVGAAAFLLPFSGRYFGAMWLEAGLVCLAGFVLSTFFYGEMAYLTMLFAGAILGSAALISPLVTILSVVPLNIAMLEGIALGRAALADLSGRANFSQKMAPRALVALIAVIACIAIGYYFWGFSVNGYFPKEVAIDLNFIKDLARQVKT